MGRHWSPGNDDLPDSGVTPGTYGDATHVGQVTVAASGLVTAASNVVITGGGGGGIGSSELIYRYTVTGSDKASIDTGVDTPDAGSNVWTNGDLLEIFITARADVTATNETGQGFFNNDTTAADYSGGILREIAGAVSGVGFGSTGSGCLFLIAGAFAAANVFSATRIVVPNYASVVAYKACVCEFGNPDQSDGNVPDNRTQIVQFKSTSAISRFACNPATAGKKFKVGSQLLIYKRLAS